MSVIRSLWFLILFVVLIFTFSPVAVAANCWNGSPAGLDFGTVTAGQTGTTATRLSFTCNNYDGQAEYVRACLKVMANNPLAMSQNEPSSTPLYFSVYSIYDQHSPLSQNNNVYAQIDFALSAGGTAEHDIPLIGKINPGQTNISAGMYYDYATAIQIAYTSASSLQALPACGALNGTTITDQIRASATVKNGCEVVSVDDMAFGSKSPAQGDLLHATSTANITVQCPTGTDYSVSIGHGLHPEGNQRALCHNGECVSYALYQDAAHSITWTPDNPEKQYSGDGQAQSLVVYGSVPPQKWPSAGVYTDTVVITLTY
ncbi:Csu type fimbrial protein [Citrobacter sp. Igbk 14]|uniref:Csu type fimbrial protein n=1 Tax=Citrobacter sp. Igbk 14 TaxID=2963960 RepID=UPI0023032A79|nr:spore coat U domain-containing protein [Citrobacter sp. Igbk 14]MDA8511167.1 spore coat U domain-containing protein [Citrobacter sp. Igbk 14]